MIQKNSCVLMKLESRIILKLFLNFSDSEPEYSYKLIPLQKRVYALLTSERKEHHKLDVIYRSNFEIDGLCLKLM